MKILVMVVKCLEMFCFDFMFMYRFSFGCMGCMFVMVMFCCSNWKEIKMVMFDVDVSSFLDYDEEFLVEFIDEEFYNFV